MFGDLFGGLMGGFGGGGGGGFLFDDLFNDQGASGAGGDFLAFGDGVKLDQIGSYIGDDAQAPEAPAFVAPEPVFQPSTVVDSSPVIESEPMVNSSAPQLDMPVNDVSSSSSGLLDAPPVQDFSTIDPGYVIQLPLPDASPLDETQQAPNAIAAGANQSILGDIANLGRGQGGMSAPPRAAGGGGGAGGAGGGGGMQDGMKMIQQIMGMAQQAAAKKKAQEAAEREAQALVQRERAATAGQVANNALKVRGKADQIQIDAQRGSGELRRHALDNIVGSFQRSLLR